MEDFSWRNDTTLQIIFIFLRHSYYVDSCEEVVVKTKILHIFGGELNKIIRRYFQCLRTNRAKGSIFIIIVLIDQHILGFRL